MLRTFHVAANACGFFRALATASAKNRQPNTISESDVFSLMSWLRPPNARYEHHRGGDHTRHEHSVMTRSGLQCASRFRRRLKRVGDHRAKARRHRRRRDTRYRLGCHRDRWPFMAWTRADTRPSSRSSTSALVSRNSSTSSLWLGTTLAAPGWNAILPIFQTVSGPDALRELLRHPSRKIDQDGAGIPPA